VQPSPRQGDRSSKKKPGDPIPLTGSRGDPTIAPARAPGVLPYASEVPAPTLRSRIPALGIKTRDPSRRELGPDKPL